MITSIAGNICASLPSSRSEARVEKDDDIRLRRHFRQMAPQCFIRVDDLPDTGGLLVARAYREDARADFLVPLLGPQRLDEIRLDGKMLGGRRLYRGREVCGSQFTRDLAQLG